MATGKHEYDDPKIIRSNSDDVKWLFAMFAASRTTLIALDKLGHRLDALGEREALMAAHEEVLRITRAIFQTFPPEKHQTINNQLDNIHFEMKIGKVPAGKDNGQVYTDIGDLDTLIYYAHRMSCTFCSHPTWCNSRCSLGKALDHCCPEGRTKRESWSEIDIEAKD